MHTERPITKDEADAFDDAVAALDNWAGEDTEPKVIFRGECCTIGTVCNLAALFSDSMPEGMYGLLYSLALQYYVEPPDDYSYASGAKCLRAVRNKCVARLEARRQWERNGPSGRRC
jgi:hypothetical protein